MTTSLGLGNGIPLEKQFMMQWHDQFGGAYEVDKFTWYSTTISLGELNGLWIVITDWTRHILPNASSPKMKIGCVSQHWPCSSRADLQSHYDCVEKLKTEFASMLNDCRRWLVITDDERDRQHGVTVRDGNHRALAISLVGHDKPIQVFQGKLTPDLSDLRSALGPSS